MMQDAERLTHEERVRALEENLWSLWTRFGRGVDCALHATDGAIWFDTPIPTLPYNTVLKFREHGDVDARIDALFAHYRRRNVPFLWIVHPTAAPSDLAERLTVRGMVEAENCPGMVMDIRDLPMPEPVREGIEIREVTDGSDMAAVLELVSWRWEVPEAVRSRLPDVASDFALGAGPVRCWLAWMGGVPVAKVILNLDCGAAGLYGVATKPEARGLGLARTLTLTAFAAAAGEGYTLGVLHSSPMAYRMYERLGFTPVAPFRLYTQQAFHV